MSAKQEDYVYTKCKNEGVICTEHVYECKNSNEEKSDSDLNLYKCAMLNDFEFTMSMLRVLK